MKHTILVNKENPLNAEFVPDNLVEYLEYNGEKIDPNYKTWVEKETLMAFFEMQDAATKEVSPKYPKGYGIVIDSGYRSYSYQKQVLEYNLKINGENAYNYVAMPGTSEHQTGLAIDIAINTGGTYNDNFDDSYEEIKWLHRNSYRFGFILRYPLGKESITGFNYECWHFRYVGKEVAQYMMENQIETLEEYKNLNLTK